MVIGITGIGILDIRIGNIGIMEAGIEDIGIMDSGIINLGTEDIGIVDVGIICNTDGDATTRLRRWLCKKHKQRSRGISMNICTAISGSSVCNASAKLSAGEGMMFCPRAGCETI